MAWKGRGKGLVGFGDADMDAVVWFGWTLIGEGGGILCVITSTLKLC